MRRLQTTLVLLGAVPLALGAPLPGQDEYRAKAFAAADAGDLPRAADLFFRLVKAGAADQEVLATGSRCLEQTGRFNDALVVLKKGTEKFPEVPQFRVGMARVLNLKAASTYKASGKKDAHVVFPYEDSIAQAELALKKWPDHREARLVLANSYYSIGQWDKAKQQAEELIQRFPDHPGGHIVMGDLALDHFKLLRQRAAQPGADTSERAMQQIAGAREAARLGYEKAIALDGDRVIAHCRLAEVMALNGEIDGALAKYFDALRIDPSAPVDHDWIRDNTKPQERYQRYEKIGQEYTTRPGAVPRKTAVFAWYGAFALIADRKFEPAEELYLLSVKLDPTFLSAYYHAMYSAYFYRDDKDAAMRYAAEYAKADPVQFADLIRALPAKHRDELTQLIRYMAKLALDIKQPHLSRDLNHVLAAIVDTADAWNNLAFMARESGEYERSEKAYRNALEIQPDSGQLMNDLAVVLHYHKKTLEAYDEAERLYQAAVTAARNVLRRGKASKEEKAIANQTIADATGNLTALKPVHDAARAAERKARKEAEQQKRR